MSTNPLTDAFRMVRAFYALLAPCAGTFTFIRPPKWRELAETARALAEHCEAAARAIESRDFTGGK